MRAFVSAVLAAAIMCVGGLTLAQSPPKQVATTLEPTPQPALAATAVDPTKIWADCQKYFGGGIKYKTTVQNKYFTTPHERIYTFGGRVPSKMAGAVCVVTYSWNTPDNRFWRSDIVGSFNGDSLFVGDLRWDWARYTPRADGSLKFVERYRYTRNDSATGYDIQERILFPVSR